MNQGTVFGFLCALIFVQLFSIINLVSDMRKTNAQMLEMLQVNHKASNVDTQILKMRQNEVIQK